MKRKCFGFGLYELLIVIVVIAVLVAILIPLLPWSRRTTQQSNETLAIDRMKTIVSAEAIYHDKHKTYGNFEELAWEGLIDDYLTDYNYRLKSIHSDNKSFAFRASVKELPPENIVARSFYVDQTGVVRGEKGLNASASSPPVMN